MASGDYKKHALAAFPRWFSEAEIPHEILEAYSEIFQDAEDQSTFWQERTYIDIADSGAPDWLNQHAKDRGTYRQSGESDAQLRTRLRSIPDALHRQTLIDAAQSIIDAAAVVGTVYLIELRRDCAFFSEWTPQGGTGGEFSTVGADAKFVPDVKFPFPPYRDIQEEFNFRLTFSSSNSAGNDGSYFITGLDGDGALYTNGSHVAEVDPGVGWILERFDTYVTPNQLVDYKDAYFDRGDRIGSSQNTIIVMLPYGTTAALARVVEESIRQKKGAGIILKVERRLNP